LKLLKDKKYQRFKPTNIICITDGAPWPYERQKDIPVQTIVTTAGKIKSYNERWKKIRISQTEIRDLTENFNEITMLPKGLRQLGVQFVQVGNDGGAAAFLMQLDKDLKTEGVPGIYCGHV
jgi:hypothetical protein